MTPYGVTRPQGVYNDGDMTNDYKNILIIARAIIQ